MRQRNKQPLMLLYCGSETWKQEGSEGTKGETSLEFPLQEAKELLWIFTAVSHTATSGATNTWISRARVKNRSLLKFWLMTPLKIMNLSCCGCTRQQSCRGRGREDRRKGGKGDRRGRRTAATRGTAKTTLMRPKRDLLPIDGILRC